MNLTYTRPGELRKPDVKVLPDGRIRITRYIAAGHGDRDYGEVVESFGATDGGLNTALLVEKGMARIEGKDAIVKTWEVRNPTGETPVGNEDVQWGENGLKTVIADFVQMSTQPYTPQTVGVTASSYDATCILRNEVMEDDGSTRQIRRFYINKGLLKQVDETRNNGALLIRTLTYLNDTPTGSIISGYTLISQNRDNPSGLPTTTYTYAKGTGQVSQDDETKNNGALLVRTIRYLSVPSVTVNPITTPTGYTKISESVADQEGHRVWAATYAKGNGLIDTSSETRLSGMLLRTTLTYLTDFSVPTNPTTDPFGSGGTVVATDMRDSDGHRVWTVTWVKAVSTDNVVDSVEYRNKDAAGNAQLVIYRRQKLGSAPSTPAATIGGTVVLINSSTQLEDGYTLYNYVWAEGKGEVTYSYDIRIVGALAVHTKSSIVTAPTTPSAVIGGTVVAVSQRSRIDTGVTIYDYEWIETAGATVSLNTQVRVDGSVVYGISVISATQSTPVYPGSGTGYLVDDAYERGNGYYTNRATYIKLPASYDFPKTVRFTIPGLAVAGNPPALNPPITKSLKATVYVSFSTSQNTDVPYTVNYYAQLYQHYKKTVDGTEFAELKALDGYLGSSSSVGSNTTYCGIAVDEYLVQIVTSDPIARPTGITILETDCEKYLTDTSGTTIWRNTSVKYTF